MNRWLPAADAGRSELGMIDKPRYEWLIDVWGVKRQLAPEDGETEDLLAYKCGLYAGEGQREGGKGKVVESTGDDVLASS